MIHESPDSIVECEVEGNKFKRMFDALAACLNEFKFGYHNILFVDVFHLRGTYDGTLLATHGIDANNHKIT